MKILMRETADLEQLMTGSGALQSSSCCCAVRAVICQLYYTRVRIQLFLAVITQTALQQKQQW